MQVRRSPRIRDGAVYSWKGIPFAAPTCGDMRFRSPEGPSPWSGVLDCERYGQIAPQSRNSPIGISSDMTIGEDCLSLNIWLRNRTGTSAR